MAAIYSNGGNRWNILGFNFTKRDTLSSVYKISIYDSTPKLQNCYSANKKPYKSGYRITPSEPIQLPEI